MPPLRDLHKTISGDFVFNVLTLKQVFEKQKPFEKLECSFLVESKNIESATFHAKLTCQKPILRQVEWVVQNGLITKNTALSLTTYVGSRG